MDGGISASDEVPEVSWTSEEDRSNDEVDFDVGDKKEDAEKLSDETTISEEVSHFVVRDDESDRNEAIEVDTEAASIDEYVAVSAGIREEEAPKVRLKVEAWYGPLDFVPDVGLAKVARSTVVFKFTLSTFSCAFDIK